MYCERLAWSHVLHHLGSPNWQGFTSVHVVQKCEEASSLCTECKSVLHEQGSVWKASTIWGASVSTVKNNRNWWFLESIFPANGDCVVVCGCVLCVCVCACVRNSNVPLEHASTAAPLMFPHPKKTRRIGTVTIVLDFCGKYWVNYDRIVRNFYWTPPSPLRRRPAIPFVLLWQREATLAKESTSKKSWIQWYHSCVWHE